MGSWAMAASCSWVYNSAAKLSATSHDCPCRRLAGCRTSSSSWSPKLSSPRLGSAGRIARSARCSAPAAEESPSSTASSAEAPEGIRETESEREQQRRSRRGAADSTDWIASSLTRRFGLGAGLAWVGFLAFGVVSEQIKTRTEVFLETQGTKDVVGAEEVVLDNGIRYVDLRKGGGSFPHKGDLVVVDIIGKIRSTGEVFLDTTSKDKRPLAYVFELKPHARGVTDGLEMALESMKAGGRRQVIVPPELAFGETGADFGSGIKAPGGEELEYDVTLQRVSIAPS